MGFSRWRFPPRWPPCSGLVRVGQILWSQDQILAYKRLLMRILSHAFLTLTWWAPSMPLPSMVWCGPDVAYTLHTAEHLFTHRYTLQALPAFFTSLIPDNPLLTTESPHSCVACEVILSVTMLLAKLCLNSHYCVSESRVCFTAHHR